MQALTYQKMGRCSQLLFPRLLVTLTTWSTSGFFRWKRKHLVNYCSSELNFRKFRVAKIDFFYWFLTLTLNFFLENLTDRMQLVWVYHHWTISSVLDWKVDNFCSVTGGRQGSLLLLKLCYLMHPTLLKLFKNPFYSVIFLFFSYLMAQVLKLQDTISEMPVVRHIYHPGEFSHPESTYWNFYF